MAKKKASGGFNMAEAIRTVLTENPSVGGKEAREKIEAKYPGKSLNPKSFGVAFYNARTRMGIKGKPRGGRKVVRKKVPAAKQGAGLNTLQAAARFLTQAGNAEAAIEAIRQVQALQLR